MKLYYSTGACSLSAHIVLREAGFPFELERVNLASKKTAGGDDYFAVNPKGYVPALVLDSGEVLTEVSAVLQYLGDKAAGKQLTPPAGTMEHYRLVEWLNFIATELHKTFSPLFNPKAPEETRQAARDTIAARLNIVEKQLQGADYLTGNHFSVADAYVFTVLSWARPMKLDLAQWPAVQAYMQRVAARPAVHDAMKAEGLIKE